MKNRHPLAINILKLQEYNFSETKLDEVVFFEWLVIKRISFGTDTFFYQQRRITEELGIKRTRLETLRKLFINIGLVVEYGNVFNTATYTVSLQFIETFIKYAVKKEYQKTKTLNIDKLHFNTKKPISIKDRKKIKFLLDDLNEVYNSRREIYNDKNIDQEYTYTGLPINEKSYKQLNELSKVYSDEIIRNSFVSYCDEVITYKDRVVKANMTNHFSSYDFTTERFEVFERHLHNYNINYSIKKV
jgi:hypothetical protein